MIVAENLNKIYSNGVHAVNNVSVSFEERHFYGIMGNSGSGKTTLLQLIGTLDTANSGTIRIDDVDILNLKGNGLAEIRYSKIGFVFQNFHLHPSLTAMENVMLPMYINKKINQTNLKKRAGEILALVGLGDRQSHYPKQLSGGEQQRVAIARALANDPPYIIADEPSGNLDSKNEVIIFDYLKLLSKDKCVIVVSHNDIIKSYADTLFEMFDGQLERMEIGEL